MTPGELSQVLELVQLLRAVFALILIEAPVLAWCAITLWRLDRRLYRVEFELGLVSGS